MAPISNSPVYQTLSLPDQAERADLRIAFVHEWFTTYAGSEKVLEVMVSEFPDADLFSLIDRLNPQQRGGLSGRKVTTTFLNRIPFVQKFYRNLLPLMPFAIEQLDMSKYDVIISNSHAVAKGVITGPDQLHICYCYTPMRYAWDLQTQYLVESGISRGLRSILARYFLHHIRIWDQRSAQGVDYFAACSHYIGRRIKKAYNRESTVIYPNVDTKKFVPGPKKDDFYLTSSRMVPYKKIHLIVEAFSQLPDKRLVVIGDGPQFKRIKALAGPNVSILGYQQFPVLLDHMQRARAFVFAAEEDFGITPLEAQACGTPVIAFGRGGATETVLDKVTGLHFYEQSASAIIEAIHAFENLETPLDPEAVRAHAIKFSTERFRMEFTNFVRQCMQSHASQKGNLLQEDQRPNRSV